jgi:carbon storage regulator
MLVLSRKKGESIIILENIVVTVVGIQGDKVRLGIEAPRDVPVHRREVYDAIKRSGGSQIESPDKAREHDSHESE